MKRLSLDQMEPEDCDYNKDLLGQVFGKWTVFERVDTCTYKVRCGCGRESLKKRFDLMCMRSTQCVRCYRSSIYDKKVANGFVKKIVIKP